MYLTARALPVLIVFLLPISLIAAEGGSTPSDQSWNGTPPDAGATQLDIDATYDFEVWAADWEIRWYLTIEYVGGGTTTHVFNTEEAAWDMAAWYAFHIVEATDFDIEPVVELGDFAFVEKFDLLADAEWLRDILEGIDLVVDIRWVKEPRREATTRSSGDWRTMTDGKPAAGLR